MGTALRFGVMCRGTTFPAWQARCIEELLSVEGVEPALLVVNGRVPPRTSAAAAIRRRLRRRDLAWALYKRAFVAGRSAVTRPVDLTERLAGVASVTCRTVPDRGGERFTQDDVDEIRRYRLDFILRFDFGILRGDVLDAARLGVWSFHHGDERRFRGGPPCFWEIVRGEAVAGAILQRLTDRLDGGVVLHRGTFRTVPHSYLRTRDAVYMGSADFPARVCREILAGDGSAVGAAPSPTDAPVYRNPKAPQLARFVATLARNFVAAQVRALARQDQWAIGVIDAPIESVLDAAGPPAVRWLTAPSDGRYLADPFFVSNGDGLSMLAEEYDHRARRGRISLVEWRPGRPPGGPRAVMDLPGHASYPFVFASEGTRYCVPETARARRVDLYRADGDDRTWRRVATLVDGAGVVDPTIVRVDGTWWLFGTDPVTGPNTKLLAWHATDLLGPWRPHALNPLKTDVRSSRPAGTPFVSNGRLYRPAQDAAATYGGRVVVHEVLRLTPTEFEEREVAAVEPDRGGPYPDGLHTLSAAGSWTLVDGKRRAFVWPAFRHELGARFRVARGGRSR